MQQQSYHHGDLRQALLREAAAVASTDGVEAITLRDLGRRVGVSHTAAAHHFGDRLGLLTDLATEGFTHLADALEAASGRGATPQGGLEAAGRAYIHFAMTQPGYFRVMFSGVFPKAMTDGGMDSAPRSRLAAAAARAYMALLDAVVMMKPGAPQAEVDAGILHAWSSVHGAAMLLLDRQLPGVDPTDDAVVNALAATLTAAVAGAINPST